MLIYVNGDSFTDGVGIADSELFPEYPGHYRSYDELPRTWPAVRDDLVNSRNMREQLRMENRARCWATHLGKLLNAKVINEAVGGSSMFAILTRTVHDLEELAKNNQIPDYVIIGLTSEERVPIINTTPPIQNDDYWIQTGHPSHINSLNSKYKKYAIEYWNSHSDEEMLLFFLYECLHLKNYVKLKTGKDPVFLNTSNGSGRYKNIINKTRIHLLKEAWDLAEFDNVANQSKFLDIAQKHGITACGHFLHEANIEYAEYIKKNILKL